VDASATNEYQTVSLGTASGGNVQVVLSGTTAGSAATLVTVDASATNEGQTLSMGSASLGTATLSLSATASGFAGSSVSVDVSGVNEYQALSNGYGYVTLSGLGGSYPATTVYVDTDSTNEFQTINLYGAQSSPYLYLSPYSYGYNYAYVPLVLAYFCVSSTSTVNHGYPSGLSVSTYLNWYSVYMPGISYYYAGYSTVCTATMYSGYYGLTTDSVSGNLLVGLYSGTTQVAIWSSTYQVSCHVH